MTVTWMILEWTGAQPLSWQLTLALLLSVWTLLFGPPGQGLLRELLSLLKITRR